MHIGRDLLKTESFAQELLRPRDQVEDLGLQWPRRGHAAVCFPL